MFFAVTLSAGLSVYPPVPGLDPSPHYRFRVRQIEAGEWQEPFAWITQCIESNEENDATKYYSQFIGGWSHTYCNFELGDNVRVVIEITRMDPDTGEPIKISSATPHPRRKVRSWRVQNGRAYILIDNPALFAVDIDGQLDENKAPRASRDWQPYEGLYPFRNENAIHTVSVFANPFITDKPDPADPSVYLVEPGEIPPETGDWTTLYFKPGVHKLFEGDRLDTYYEGFDFQLHSDKSYYIPGDAIVYGHMNTFDKANEWEWTRNVRVFGHGTLSGAKSSHPEDMDKPYSHINTDEGKRFRSLELLGTTGSTVEGITFADAANHTMKMNTRGHAELDQKPANYARWLKVFTWRANGDGITMLGNGYLEDSFIRTQDDGTYVRGLGIRRVVYWNDVNGTALRSTFIMNDRRNDFPSTLPDTLYVEDIDIIYGRGVFHLENARYAVIQKQNFRQRDGNVGDHVVFRNINYEDPMSQRALFGFDTRVDRGAPVGNPSGIRFENIRAAGPSVFDRPNTFWGGLTDEQKGKDPTPPDIQMTGFIFDNVVIGGRQIDSMAEFETDENVSGFIFENTEPQTRTFLNSSGYGKWYVYGDWDEGVEPADHDIVNHTSVPNALTIDAQAYAGALHVSHAQGAVIRLANGGILAVADSVSVGDSGSPGRILLIDGTLEIRNDDRDALSVPDGKIHFSEGTLSWAGDQIAAVEELYNAGAVSFGNGQVDNHSETAVVIAVEDQQTLYAEFDDSTGYTTVWLAADSVHKAELND